MTKRQIEYESEILEVASNSAENGERSVVAASESPFSNSPKLGWVHLLI